jgi:glucose-6-phosphate dehydrogenase assembly protein OpcA
MGVVAEIERKLSRSRCEKDSDDVPDLRTSTMTHVVWAPPVWFSRARRVLKGLAERHPARTIFLVPLPGRRSEIEADASVETFQLDGGREVVSEVVEIRMRGDAVRHPASLVVPLLISDLPAFCRWRGEPGWQSGEFRELATVVDRLVVDSSEWKGRLPAAYESLAGVFDRVATSDIAWRRTLPWRVALAGRWPGIRSTQRLSVEGPHADALLLAGWLRTRLRRDIALSRRAADAVEAVRVDGDRVEPPAVPRLSSSDLLSAELDVYARDPVYETAVRAAAKP